MSEKINERAFAMNISFLGAVANDVTGSCTLLEITMGNKTRKILVDCGMLQGE